MINYDLTSIRAMIFDVDGVLSKPVMNLSDTGDPIRTVNVKDGYALQLAVKMGLHLCIITGARVDEVRKRYEGLGIKDVYIASSIKINDFNHFVEKYNLKPEEILYMGDDIPDWQVMSLCGLPCCPADACPEIQALCKYVSPYKGGEGCVRDVLEHVLKMQGKWMKDNHAFGW